ncbi:hypothetical protein [Thermoanaerobacterium sp. DL9XJH110]|uniref:hypothetical protein n=1 Tax=Thermoanaerobacterium sp. DL9XJH110 TaxID=3386643 RepID=UPI003BB71417
MIKFIYRSIMVVIAALILSNFYFAPRSVVAYNTNNLTSVSRTVYRDFLKLAQQN